MRRKKVMAYRPPLWFPLWVLDEKKRKPQEGRTETARDKAREDKAHSAAAIESISRIPKGDPSTPRLFRQVRQQEHMRLTRRVQEQPQLFSDKRLQRIPTPNRIVGPRFVPILPKPFVPLKERLK